MSQISPRVRPRIGPVLVAVLLLPLAAGVPAWGATLAGTVVDGGGPAAGVAVGVYDSSGSLVSVATTGTDGGWSLDGLSPGTFFALTGSDERFPSRLFDDLDCAFGCSVAAGTPIELGEDGRGGVDFVLTAGGRLAGRVVDRGDGMPIAAAAVSVLDRDGFTLRTAFSGLDGDWTLGGLPEGDYALRVAAGGYLGRTLSSPICLGPSCDQGPPLLFGVRAGETTTIPDVGLDHGGTLRGRVTDAAGGGPLANVRIDVFDLLGDVASAGASDEDGAWTVGGLPDGNYFVRTSGTQGYLDALFGAGACPFGRCDPTTGTAVGVARGETTGGVDFALERGGGISGRVRSLSGDDLFNVPVTVYDEGGHPVASVLAFGGYTVEGLPAGTYFVLTTGGDSLPELWRERPCGRHCNPTGGRPVLVELGEVTGGVDFTLTPGAGIAGRVRTPDGDGVGFVSVFAHDAEGRFVADAFADRNGRYRLGGLRPGTYFVSTPGRGELLGQLYPAVPCPFAACDVTAGQAIVLRPGDEVTGVDFALTPSRAISGTVREAGSGRPLADVPVRAYDSGGQSRGFDATDDDGGYRLNGLAAGDWFVVAGRLGSSSGGFYADQVYDGLPCPFSRCDPTAGTAVTLTADADRSGVDFALERGASVAGSLTDAASGEVDRGFTQVLLIDAAGAELASTFVDRGGRYRLSGLAAGTFFVRTRSGSRVDELWDDVPCPFGCPATLGDAVGVALGEERSGVDFALERGATLRGKVFAADLAPLDDGVRVEVYDAGGDLVTAAETTSLGISPVVSPPFEVPGLGRGFEVSGLPAGTYHVKVGAPGYVDRLWDDVPCAPGCDPTSGTPLDLAAGSLFEDLRFDLDRGGTLAGTVTDAATGEPVRRLKVRVYDATGGLVRQVLTNARGRYAAARLPSGAYLVRTPNERGYEGELWDDVPCPRGCDVLDGTPVEVEAGTRVDGIDFALERDP